jgi:hypothetical protein
MLTNDGTPKASTPTTTHAGILVIGAILALVAIRLGIVKGGK